MGKFVADLRFEYCLSFQTPVKFKSRQMGENIQFKIQSEILLYIFLGVCIKIKSQYLQIFFNLSSLNPSKAI